ncbi:Unknown protein [Striga hermonthica]|uniref:Uncharacterized protein n=1 Tax=Striga hermonthica TaxID=68872 RepID=A0A9N7N283_STRHE|nr:Unknown protein [Striga hermonthica]
MVDLHTWEADVVGGDGGGRSDDENDANSIPLIFTPDQLDYTQELDRKSASLYRSIQDLRLRLPPPDIPQRLLHIHAHSFASNNAPALQLNAHSATKEHEKVGEEGEEENGVWSFRVKACSGLDYLERCRFWDFFDGFLGFEGPVVSGYGDGFGSDFERGHQLAKAGVLEREIESDGKPHQRTLDVNDRTLGITMVGTSSRLGLEILLPAVSSMAGDG